MAFIGLGWEKNKFTNTLKRVIDKVTMSASSLTDSDSEESKKPKMAILTAAPDNKVLVLKERDESDSSLSSRTEADGGEGIAESFVSMLSSLVSSLNTSRRTMYTDGVDFWVPTENDQIVSVPDDLVASYEKVHPNAEAPAKFALKNGDFSVVTAKTSEVKDPEKSTSKKEGDEKTESKPLRHLVVTFYPENGKKRMISLYRSNSMSSTVGLCERCRENPMLFQIIPSDVKDTEYFENILRELREHVMWKSIHIAARLGLIDYLDEIRVQKLSKMFHLACQPEGLTPLMIAVKYDQIEMVKRMLGKKASLDVIGPDGSNLMHMAAVSSSAMIDELWTNEGCRPMINRTDSAGNTPTYVAFSNGYILNSRHLSNLGGNLSVTSSERVATPFLDAMKKGKVDETMIDRVLELTPTALEETDPITGDGVIHCASNKKTLLLLLHKAADRLDASSLNKKNQTPLHVFVRRSELPLVMAINAFKVDINAIDCDGNTAVHLAASRGKIGIIRTLLCLGADPNIINKHKETARHLAARYPDKKKAEMIVQSLIICGAHSCPIDFIGCAFGCMNEKNLTAVKQGLPGKQVKPEKTEDEKVKSTKLPVDAPSAAYEFELDPDTRKVDEAYAEENPTRMYPHLLAISNIKARLEEIAAKKEPQRLINVLSLDGGGIRGLVMVQVLICLQSYLEKPFASYFDWIAATSTGTYVSSALLTGKDLRLAQKMYLRIKDSLFDSWTRPYDTPTLEYFLKKSFGEGTMADIEYPKIFFTTVRADTFPVQLDLLRNYRLPLSDEENEELGFTDPKKMELWKASRRSSAAPTYFAAAEGKYIDGGMIANNPTLDLLSEIHFWNMCCKKSMNPEKCVEVGCVLSVGTGVVPVCPVDPSVLEMGNIFGMLRGIKNLSMMVIDQATATEGAPITRSRSWCHSLGIPFFRLNAPLFKDILLDANEDEDLAKIMWDAVVYSHTHKKDFEELAQLLKLIGTNEERRKRFGHN